MSEALPALVAALGNPGPEYADTRHNVGWMVLDDFLAGLKPRPPEARHEAESWVWDCRYAGRRVLCAKPLTYMNLSGKAVGQLARRYGLAPEAVLCLFDDMDLPLGRLRFRKRGGSGGHNGVQSVIDGLESGRFGRLRVGIGGEGGGRDHVLSPFTEDEQAVLREVRASGVQALQLALRRGLTVAMNEYNGKVLGSAAEPSEQPEESE